MDFKEFLRENAHRTGTRSDYYPPQYDTHGIWDRTFPLLHQALAADNMVWQQLKVFPRKWDNYEMFLRLEKNPFHIPKVK